MVGSRAQSTEASTQRHDEAVGGCVHCGLPVPRLSTAAVSGGGAGPLPIRFCCYGCRVAYHLALAGSDDAGPSARPNTLLLRLGLGIFCAMNIMAFSFFFYSQEIYQPRVVPGDQAQFTMMAGLFAYLLLLLCTVVVVALGAPLAMDAVERFASFGFHPRSVDTNLLILIGVVAAYGLSAVHTVRGGGELYYDTAAMILVLVTLGHWIDSVARRRVARSARSLIERDVAKVWRREGERVVGVEPASLVVGDEVRVCAGEAVTVDGEVLEGQCHVDESILTGESQPRPVAPGDRVLAGSVALDGQLWITARQVGCERVIDLMKDRMEQARRRQPRVGRLADRVAAGFVPGVVVLAVGVWLTGVGRHDATGGLFNALSVLLISCPCALGLAAPLATWCAMGRAQQLGVLIDSGATLERMASVTDILFDKTGTLTTGAMSLTRVDTAESVSTQHALTIAAAIESGSLHPIARALVAAAEDRSLTPPRADRVQTLAGVGVEGRIDGRVYRLGRPLDDPGQERADDEPLSRVDLSCQGTWLARYWFSEQLRSDASGVVNRLRSMGFDLRVVTGDHAAAAMMLGRELGLPVHAGLLPQDKLSILEQRHRESGGLVAMVGDGINDGPVLAGADVGVVVANASDLARRAGHVTLLSPRLDRIPLVFAIARGALRRVRLNLCWAFGYNTIGLTLAAAGYLNPLFAASAMFVSSLLIVVTSVGAGRDQRQVE